MAKWNLDSNHSSAVFEARHMMVTWITGRLNMVTGTLYFDPAEVAKSSVDVEIDVSSLCTGLAARDEDLKGPSYLDAERFPIITFKSTRAEVAGLDHS